MMFVEIDMWCELILYWLGWVVLVVWMLVVFGGNGEFFGLWKLGCVGMVVVRCCCWLVDLCWVWLLCGGCVDVVGL